MGVHLHLYRRGDADESFDVLRRVGDRAFAWYLTSPETGQAVNWEDADCDPAYCYRPEDALETFYRPANLDDARRWIVESGEVSRGPSQRRLLDVIDRMDDDPDVVIDISW